MKYLIILFLVVASSFRLLAGDNLGSGQPGLKIMYKGTNQFVIYLDEPWTVGVGLMGGYYERHIDVLFDRNYGYAQVYAPAGHDLIAYEPMTAPTNALASGDDLQIVRPGEAYTAAFRISVT